MLGSGFSMACSGNSLKAGMMNYRLGRALKIPIQFKISRFLCIKAGSVVEFIKYCGIHRPNPVPMEVKNGGIAMMKGISLLEKNLSPSVLGSG
jgi:hypothetical protein